MDVSGEVNPTTVFGSGGAAWTLGAAARRGVAFRSYASVGVDAPFELGEVSFHQGWTFHRAGENRSAAPRSVMTIIYMDEQMRLKPPSNANQAADRAQWCPGAAPGEVIATPKNPVIFSRAEGLE